MDSILASHTAAPGLILRAPDFFQEKVFLKEIFDVAKIYRQRTALRERERVTVQSLIVDRTHLVLVSGKLVLQKTWN